MTRPADIAAFPGQRRLALWKVRLGIHQLVDALTAALDAKHAYTKGHSDRVADIAFAIARAMGLPRRQQYEVHVAAHLHDIGKIGIPDELLLKPQRLTTAEYEVIKRHAAIGGDILIKIDMLREFAPAVRHHHERWDGGGYPDGLAGEDIPLTSRIICLADAYDAMTSPHSYRPSLSHGTAAAEISRCAGSQFDPRVAAAFLDMTARRRWGNPLAKKS